MSFCSNMRTSFYRIVDMIWYLFYLISCGFCSCLENEEIEENNNL